MEQTNSFMFSMATNSHYFHPTDLTPSFISNHPFHPNSKFIINNILFLINFNNFFFTKINVIYQDYMSPKLFIKIIYFEP